jgi:phytoene dehydrogenase-like protein
MKNPDVIVIGADPGGLAAAAYLSGAGKRVLVLEQSAMPAEPIGPVYALDPLVLSELKLASRGLRFVQRDLPLAFAAPGIVSLGRNPHEAARELGRVSLTDAAAWPGFRRELYALARQLRVWWWSALADGAPGWVLERAKAKALFARLSVTGADAFLAAHFESEALIAALLFDASAGGFHVSEPGSALALVWRAAQEMAGLEGAASMPAPGTLIWSLIKAAGGADFRCCAEVTAILTHGGRGSQGQVSGVRLKNGEEIKAGCVLSSLGRSSTMALAGQPSSPQRLGESRLLISLRQKIAFTPARMVLAERADIYAGAHEAARGGRLPAELPMEFSAAAPDKIAVTLRPVPANLNQEDRVQLAARAVRALERQIPGAAALVTGLRFSVSAPERANLTQLLLPPLARVQTKTGGLYLGGAEAEPVPSLSGRAARIAATAILKSQK